MVSRRDTGSAERKGFAQRKGEKEKYVTETNMLLKGQELSNYATRLGCDLLRLQPVARSLFQLE
ncbi:hypothetical protein SY85_18610 [Flavisolibacter tropicus]|uniref:Uncharacterized protein n=1 Tax=Flavisolibacter tropicus TaxID=1492898 RepID=A0A172TYZ2_9BACT|nr:hypothetical protein SY85_18610 [Flavisolibacter tropicus]